MGNWAPLGYLVENRKLVPDDAEAEKVRWIFTRYLQTGSVTTVVKELTAEGFFNRYGQRPIGARSNSWGVMLIHATGMNRGRAE